MDAIDKSLLNELLKNCRVTYQELANKHGISANAIKKRVRKLEESGFIASYRVTLTPAMFDADMLFGFISTDGSQHEVEFVDRIGENPFILAAASYSDGHYALLAEYTSSNELLKIGAYLRSLPGSEDVELFSIIGEPGGKMELTKLHLRVLSFLVKAPRMSIVDLAKNTGLTARRVRHLIEEMMESGGILFSVNYKLGVVTTLPFLLRLTYDESIVDYSKVVNWINEKYPLSIWDTYISDLDPTIFILFSAEGLLELDSIVRTVRKQKYIKSVKVTISQYHKRFFGLRDQRLNEMIKEAGYD